MSAVLCSMVGSTFASAAPVSGTWTTTSLADVLTSISQYTGITKGSIGIHGIQNTNNLVLTLASQNAARNAWAITPVVVNLSTGVIAKGSTTALTATNTGTNYLGAMSAGDHTGSISYGAVSMLHYNGSIYLHRIYGYTFGNWGSASPSNVPTLSLSAAYNDTTAINSEAYFAYAGGGRFTACWRDNAAGDLTVFRTFTYAGTGTPSVYSPKSAGSGNRGTGYTSNFYAGLTAGNVAAHSAQAGNNANPLVTFAHTGNASNSRVFSKADVIPADSRSAFDGELIRDVSASNFFVHAANKGSTGTYELYSGQITNANTPTATPTVTFGAILSVVGGAGALFEGDRNTLIYRARYISNLLNITPITLNTSTRALTLGTEVATTSVGNGQNTTRGFYNATYGQWVINAYWNGNIQLYVSKLNP